MGARSVRVPLGVDPAAFPLREAEPPAPPWRLVHVGSINAVKDQATLLDALARLDAAGLHLLVEGGVEEHRQDGRRRAVARRAAELGLTDRVDFTGWVPWTRLARHYHRAHALVVSSRHETGPVAALEAAACGVPVTGTAVGHLRDWAAEGMIRVAPPADPEALADVIAELLADGPRRLRVAAELRTFSRAHDADATARAFEEVYARARSG